MKVRVISQINAGRVFLPGEVVDGVFDAADVAKMPWALAPYVAGAPAALPDLVEEVMAEAGRNLSLPQSFDSPNDAFMATLGQSSSTRLRSTSAASSPRARKRKE